jgi:hypothetical protein
MGRPLPREAACPQVEDAGSAAGLPADGSDRNAQQRYEVPRLATRHESRPVPAREPAKQRTEHEAGLRRKGNIGRDTDDDAKRRAHHGSERDGGSDAHARESMFVFVHSAPNSGRTDGRPHEQCSCGGHRRLHRGPVSRRREHRADSRGRPSWDDDHRAGRRVNATTGGGGRGNAFRTEGKRVFGGAWAPGSPSKVTAAPSGSPRSVTRRSAWRPFRAPADAFPSSDRPLGGGNASPGGCRRR